jgi:catechol 2,3-dioxygenase-like lactoylglutathione lyase family enzyme
MAPAVRLDHCVIHVSDWERSNAFYTNVLGAELVQVRARWSYRFGDQQLNLHGPGVEADPVASVPVPPGGSDLEREGVEVEMGPVERRGARGVGTSVYFRDPDGSLLEFISYASA